jgi:hypothetical protein
MKIIQISVFLENRKGRLYEVCRLLGEHQISIRALHIAEATDFGVLRMVVDKPDAAQKLLRENNFVANRTDVVAIEVNDRPGGLADILQLLTKEDLNVEYMYAFVEKRSDKALVVFRFDDTEKALRLLAAHNISVVRQADLAAL